MWSWVGVVGRSGGSEGGESVNRIYYIKIPIRRTTVNQHKNMPICRHSAAHACNPTLRKVISSRPPWSIQKTPIHKELRLR